MATILIVEDDSELAELYRLVLVGNGHQTHRAKNGREALDMARALPIDLFICDIMMPVMDGFELTRSLRDEGFDQPVLVVTAKGALADKHEGFSAGADDYVVKPVDVNELAWRVDALLRRAHIVERRCLVIGGTELDEDALSVRRAGEELVLPKKEFTLLLKLLSSPGRVFTRHQLMEDVWGTATSTDPHTLDVHISRLRERLRENPDFKIVTVRGLGYKAVVAHE